MANEVKDMMAAVATVVDAVSGIRTATSEPRESQSVDPFAVVFLFSGEFGTSPIGTKRSLTTVAIDVLKVRRDLPRDLATINPFIDSVTTGLISEIADGGGRFSNTIQTFGDIKVMLLPRVDYAGVEMIGYRFLMENVKILVNL